MCTDVELYCSTGKTCIKSKARISQGAASVGNMLTEGGEDSSGVHAAEDPPQASGDKASGQEGSALATAHASFLNLQEASRRSWMALLVGPKLSPGPKAWAWLSPAQVCTEGPAGA